MKFGRVQVREAAGAILAHTTRVGDRTIRKGEVLTDGDIVALLEADRHELVVARPEPGDVAEDEAARRVGAAVAGDGLAADAPVAGRVNLRATGAGLLLVNAAGIAGRNRHDEAITLATLRPHAAVAAHALVATVKIIPFAAPAGAVAAWERDGPALSLAPFVPKRAALIQTVLPAVPARALDRGRDVTAGRLSRLGSTLVAETRCAHAEDALVDAIRAVCGTGIDLLLIAGASAISDRRDVIPAAIVAAGGAIVHFGAPMDPGNLLLSGRIGALPALGLPGCARSPRLNGIDLVLRRLLAGLPLEAVDIMGMGVGGLLADDPERGHRRTGPASGPAAP